MAKRRYAVMIGSVATLTLLAVILLMGLRNGWDFSNSFNWLKPRENDVYRKNSYTVSDKKAAKKRDEVIATMGEVTLTNGQLQIYYWMQVYDFISTYGDSAAQLGFDYTADLARQIAPDGKTTWQQYFLENALETWKSNQAFAILAERNGFEMTEEDKKYLETIEEELEKTATSGGYANADEMVQVELGPGCTAADYASYLRVYFVAYRYFTQLYNAIEISDEEIEAYFQENMKDFSDAGIVQTPDLYVDLRHIQIIPENGRLNADGYYDYPEEAWDVCKAEAERILSLWTSGEKTEESFIDLVSIYSQDEATAQTGGMYSNMVKGEMDEALDEWFFADGRKSGDYALIKSNYGYHIVYFVEAEEIWYSESRDAIREKRGQEMVDEVLADFPTDIAFKQIALARLEFGNK